MLSRDALASLTSIPKDRRGSYPAAATLKDGSECPAVLFFEIGSKGQHFWIPRIGLLRTYFRFRPERMIDPSSVVSIHPSRFSIPPPIQNKIFEKLKWYGMGDIIPAKFIMQDGIQLIYEGVGTSAAVFISLPSGFSNTNIVDVEQASYEEVEQSEKAGKKIMDQPFRLCMFQK